MWWHVLECLTQFEKLPPKQRMVRVGNILCDTFSPFALNVGNPGIGI